MVEAEIRERLKTLHESANDQTRPANDRVNDLLEALRLQSSVAAKFNENTVLTNNEFVELLMQDERGHEIIVRSVVKLARDVTALNMTINLLTMLLAK